MLYWLCFADFVLLGPRQRHAGMTAKSRQLCFAWNCSTEYVCLPIAGADILRLASPLGGKLAQDDTELNVEGVDWLCFAFFLIVGCENPLLASSCTMQCRALLARDDTESTVEGCPSRDRDLRDWVCFARIGLGSRTQNHISWYRVVVGSKV